LNLTDKVHVLLHDILIILTVDLVLLLKTLLQRVVRRIKILPLVSVFFPNIRVHVHILDLVIFHVFVQTVHERLLELIMVIDVLNGPVNVVLELTDNSVKFANIGPVIFNQLLHVLLPITQVINCKAESTVGSIASLKIVVHQFSVYFELVDGGLSGCNIALQVLDLVVEHKLELFKLLSFLLESVNVPLLNSNLEVLNCGFLLLLSDLALQVINLCLLLLNLLLLILNKSIQALRLLLNLTKLITSDLQVSLSLKTHILYLG